MNSLLLRSNFALTWAGDKGKSYQSREHTINHAKCEQKFKAKKTNWGFDRDIESWDTNH